MDAPPAAPKTLGEAFPHLQKIGTDILETVQRATRAFQGSEEAAASFLDYLPTFLESVRGFASDALAAEVPRDLTAAFWAERTYKAVKDLEVRQQAAPSGKGVVPLKSTRTWAAIAQWTSPESRALREVKVRVGDSTERKQIWATPNKEILQKLVKQIGEEAGVVGVRKYPSGDLAIQLKDQKDKKEVEGKQKEWTKVVAKSAKILPTLYPVFIHGVRVKALDLADQRTTVQKLQDQNRTLHPGAKFLKAAWLRRRIDPSQQNQFSSLILFCLSPELANDIIRKGLVEGGEVKTTERFVAGCSLVQCFRCCSFGHIAKYCRLPPKCGHCSLDHESRDCSTKEAKPFCPNCPGSGLKNREHNAWSSACRTRQSAKQEAWGRKDRFSPFFETEVIPDRREPAKTRGRPRKETLSVADPPSKRQATISFRTESSTRMDVERRDTASSL